MTLPLEDLKLVKDEVKDLVNGFVRTEVAQDTIIPSLVVSICILFYNLREYWNICGDGMVIEGDSQQILTSMSKQESPGYQNCYSHIPINDEYDCIYSWTLNRIKSNYFSIYVGIHAVDDAIRGDKKYVNSFSMDHANSSCYCINSTGLVFSHNGQYKKKLTPWSVGHRIKITVDTKQKSIEFCNSNGSVDVTIENIDFDDKVYYLFVSAYIHKREFRLELVDLCQKFV